MDWKQGLAKRLITSLFNFGIFMQSVDMPSSRGGCCIRFGTEEDLRKAYDLLSREAIEFNPHMDWHNKNLK